LRLKHAKLKEMNYHTTKIVIYMICNATARNCGTEICLGTISLYKSELAKSTYAAVIDKAQDSFPAIGIHYYRVNIIPDEGFSRLRPLANMRCLKRIWNPNLYSPLRVEGTGLHTRAPDNIARV
jgi:hypothetical protein